MSFYTLQGDAAKLVFELKNSRPIELSDLTKSLSAVANQYRRFVIREDLHSESEAKLYVKEVRDGSTIVELFAYAQSYSEPVVTAVKASESVIKFGIFLKKAYDDIRNGRKPAEVTAKDISDISKILEPTVKDPGGQLLIHADRGSTIEVTINLNHSDANTVQNQSSRLVEEISQTDQREFAKRAFYWDTTSKGAPRTTDRGVIETIDPRPIPVIFDDPGIKDQMIEGKAHPFTTIYIVDVETITAQGKLKVYNIKKLHEIIEDDDEDED